MAVAARHVLARKSEPRRLSPAVRARVELTAAGVTAGTIAGMASAGYSMPGMVLLSDNGILTPLYALATPLVGPGAMRRSIEAVLYVDPGTMLLGLLVHLALAVAVAVPFGFVARSARLAGLRSIGWGVFFGMALAAATALLVPAVHRVEGGLLFLAQHVVYGVVLGAWPLVRPQDVQPHRAVSHDAVAPKRGDLLRRQPQLPQHVGGVLPQQRRRAA